MSRGLGDVYKRQIKAGDELKEPAYGRLRPGHFIIGGDDKEKVIEEMEKILQKIKVVFK